MNERHPSRQNSLCGTRSRRILFCIVLGGNKVGDAPAIAELDDDGWAPLAYVGQIITKQRPDFDSRNYGYAKLSDLMAATTLFDLERRVPGDGKAAVIYARDNRRRTPA